MKFSWFFLLFIQPLTTAAQFAGSWNGIVKTGSTELPIVFHITAVGNEFSALLDSPSQGLTNLPVTSTIARGDSLFIEMTNLELKYRGKLLDTIIGGEFRQGLFVQELNLRRGTVKAKPKPQEPQPPFPYKEREVSVDNSRENVTLAGTLTIPEGTGPFPAVVMITGSGPQDRDEALLGHKPFLVIADFLTRNGIAVLRMDDRGTGKSTGNFDAATSENFVTDIEAGLRYLKSQSDINPNQIGLIGHSEGGMIAPMVAARNSDVAFIVSLAGLGIPGDEILLLQQRLIAKANGTGSREIEEMTESNTKLFEIVTKSENLDDARIRLEKHVMKELKKEPDSKNPGGKTDAQVAEEILDQIASPWMYYFIRFDPAPHWKAVRCPVLAVNGSKDLQVPPAENLNAIRNHLAAGGNSRVTTKEYPNLNHLFQHAKTGAPSEYAALSETFSPEVLADMRTWINQQTTR